MHSFTDTKDREWHLSLDGYTQEKVRTGVERDGKGLLLTSIGDEDFKLLADLYDPNNASRLLVPVLWCMVEDQADERTIDPKEFARGLSGDALRNAADALVRAIADFFTNPARAALLKMMEVGKAVETRTHALAEEQLAREIASLDVEQLARSYMDSIGSLRPSPDATHSESTRLDNSA